MPLPTKRAADREKMQGVKIQMWGTPKIGKTFQAQYLNPEKTLFLDAEKGMLSLKDWNGHSLDILDWPTARNIACFLGGPSRIAEHGKTYSKAHFAAMQKKYGDRREWNIFDHIFIDSTTLIGQYCMTWAKQQPEAFNKHGEKNMLGAYGLLGSELMEWAWRLQAIPRINVILVGGVKTDEDGNTQPLLDGSAANKLLYVFDQIVTLAWIDEERKFICQPNNEWGYPAGDRSGQLDMVEEPRLDKLLEKIKA